MLLKIPIKQLNKHSKLWTTPVKTPLPKNQISDSSQLNKTVKTKTCQLTLPTLPSDRCSHLCTAWSRTWKSSRTTSSNRTRKPTRRLKSARQSRMKLTQLWLKQPNSSRNRKYGSKSGQIVWKLTRMMLMQMCRMPFARRNNNMRKSTMRRKKSRINTMWLNVWWFSLRRINLWKKEGPVTNSLVQLLLRLLS